jgi:3'-phosphoadenosine 5'-phosphosulfate (PAPS) 3'-phosphatase
LAPGQLILQEAGGSLRDLKGMEINYSGDMEQKSGLIAATSEDLILKVSNLVSEEKFNLKK